MSTGKPVWGTVATTLLSVCGVVGTLFGAWMNITSAQAVQAAEHRALAARTDRLESDTSQIRRDIKEELKEIRLLIERQQRSNP